MKKSTIVLLLILILSTGAAASAEAASTGCNDCGSCEDQSQPQKLAEMPINSGTETRCLLCPIDKPVLLPDLGIDFSFREADYIDGSKQTRVDDILLFLYIKPPQTIKIFYLRC